MPLYIFTLFSVFVKVFAVETYNVEIIWFKCTGARVVKRIYNPFITYTHRTVVVVVKLFNNIWKGNWFIEAWHLNILWFHMYMYWWLPRLHLFAILDNSKLNLHWLANPLVLFDIIKFVKLAKLLQILGWPRLFFLFAIDFNDTWIIVPNNDGRHHIIDHGVTWQRLTLFQKFPESLIIWLLIIF